MIENLTKNLWLLLTIALPGFFTYGMWRLCLFFVPDGPLSDAALKQVDDSTLMTTSIILTFALMQQTVAIALEGIFYLLARKAGPKHWFRILFRDRFLLAYRNKLSDQAEKIIGNFFLSLNMTIGTCLLIAYFAFYVSFEKSMLVTSCLIGLLPFVAGTTYFRMVTAGKIISECESVRKKQKKGKKTEKADFEE